MKKIENATLCKHYNDEQGCKNGKACELYGRCMPFYYNQDCKDYVEKQISDKNS